MDTSNIPPWLVDLWRELTKPPAVIGQSRSRNAPRQQPGDDERDELQKKNRTKNSWRLPVTPRQEREDPSESPTDPRPSSGTGGSPSTALRASQRYFVARKTGRPATKPRPHPGRRPRKPSNTVAKTSVSTNQVRLSASTTGTLLNSTTTASAEPSLSTVNAWDDHVTSIEPWEGIWRITTSDGRLLALKETHRSIAHIRFMADALSHIQAHGCTHVTPIVRTLAGEPFVAMGHHTYYASEWARGRPVRWTAMDELGATARGLARFHEASKGYEGTGYSPVDAYAVHALLTERRAELQAWLRELEQEYPSYSGQSADESLRILALPEVLAHIAESRSHPGLCHLDVTPRNVIFTPSGSVKLIDFDLMTFGPRGIDLAHLIRRTMQGNGVWQNEYALPPLIAYNRVRPMSPGEYLLVEALLTFPHRVWRLLKDYTREPSDRNLSRLRQAFAQEDSRQSFLDTFARQVTRRTAR